MSLNRVTWARPFAVAGLGLAILGVVGTVVVRLVAPAPIVGAFGFNEITMIGFLTAGLTWASVGALLVTRRPENTIGWLMVVLGVGYTLSQCSVSLTFAFAAESTAEGDRDAQIAGWATVLLQLVTILQLAIGFLFPTGRVQSPRWGWFMRFFWSVAFVFVVISLTQPGPLQLIPGVQNPFALGPDLRGGRPIAPILILATLILFPSLVISMVTRYRSAGHVERQQMKWFVLSLGISAIGLAFVSTEVVLLNHPDETTGLNVYIYAGAVVPVAIGIAILRNGLYDIDRIISRTISYASLTAVLAAMFTRGGPDRERCPDCGHPWADPFVGGRVDRPGGLDARRVHPLPAGPDPRPARGGPALRPCPVRWRTDHRRLRRAAAIRHRPGVHQCGHDPDGGRCHAPDELVGLVAASDAMTATIAVTRSCTTPTP